MFYLCLVYFLSLVTFSMYCYNVTKILNESIRTYKFLWSNHYDQGQDKGLGPVDRHLVDHCVVGDLQFMG